MHPDLKAEWDAMPPEQRVMRCHVLAVQAEMDAASAPAHLRDSFVRIAKGWLRVAKAVAKSAPGSPPASANPL
jgi:hypothetical protein